MHVHRLISSKRLIDCRAGLLSAIILHEKLSKQTMVLALFSFVSCLAPLDHVRYFEQI